MDNKLPVLRPPTEAEQKVSPEMFIYIQIVILGEQKITLGYYDNIKVLFDVMAILKIIRPELYKATAKKLEENGGMKTILSSGPLVAATTICKNLVTAAKEVAEYQRKNK